ncbi:hypothetical protein ZIOFF_007566 [Zingiber officinale]|uniref:Uncharacterized protein n=1 Tax=Zingiber officinale TaxID=94328 RepID=A0A8J5I578_ZINOF|nr:hypothetical protein ZIOFF_007566 [Zingiber officinale]
MPCGRFASSSTTGVTARAPSPPSHATFLAPPPKKSSHSNGGLHLADAVVSRPTDTDCDASRIQHRWRRTPPRPPPMSRDPFLHAAVTNKRVEALRGDDRRRHRVASSGRRMHPCALLVCENESTRLDIKQASDGTQDVPGLLEPQVGSIDDVWHNYSFDSDIIGNNGIKLAGFHVDTMHLARLFDSSRTNDGGYSLEALTSDPKIMSQGNSDDDVELISGKMSMKSIFGKKKLKKDGTEGKIITLPPVDVLQREERRSWIRYSALDAVNTLKLFNLLKGKLMRVPWFLKGIKMESEGILVDKVHLSKIEKLAVGDKQIVADKFRRWASKYCEDAKYINVGRIMDDHKLSDTGTDYEDCSYGTAFEAFGGGNKGREACEAIAALCETFTIDSLITNFIIPLQVN